MQTPRNIVDAVAADLWTIYEIGKKTKYTPSAIDKWRYAYRDFPKPVRKDPTLWYWPDVKQWMLDNGKVNERDL